MDDYVIERMGEQDIEVAVSWAKAEGWNPGLNDGHCFYQTDPKGFFVGKLKGEIIAVGSAVAYDENYGFCGFYIVDEAHRHQGYGLELTLERLAYMGERNVGIDGVLDMCDKYARLGYQMAHKNSRYRGQMRLAKIPCEAIVDAREIDFEHLLTYDARHFFTQREAFLKPWIEQDNALALAYVGDGRIKGFGVIRECFEGYKIGPLFADNEQVADTLFNHLVHHIDGAVFLLDIPEVNTSAQALVSEYGLSLVFETGRMYLRGEPDLPLDDIYGITSLELG